MRAIENEIKEMHKGILKDMKIINPTSILQFEDGNTYLETLIKTFQNAMFKIKDNNTPTSQDFTIVANTKSMLYLNKEIMSRKRKRIRR